MLFNNFNRYLIPIVLVATTGLVVPQLVIAARQEARAILAREVGAIAKKTVVRIESSDGSFGSGVIIGRTESGTNNVYTVLTAGHVVKCADCKYQIVTPVPIDTASEKKRIKIDLDMQNNLQKMPDVDLATISFESNSTFAIGTIGNSEYADEGSPVYVAGFPKPGQAIKRIALQFTGGMISSRIEEGDRDPKNRNNGYDIAYTNITRAGMSGGPVFDAAGRVIAIHGQGDRNSQNAEAGDKDSSANVIVDDEKTGFNLGIPMQTYLKLQPQAVAVVGAKFDDSPLNYQVTDRSVTIGTPSRKFIQKVRTRGTASPLFDVTTVSEQTDD
ncbi:serine protease [Chamaesiphon sp. OTE_75_metabat_556]|uniref:S1 family peptidase n=1 Tax=Chamaesiphon sp. OTE_75_metabat_556 TaxID=2964692 RepID=UPI00286BFFBB|nr:serine protease [Chamaesiphon sp. OTE_75_metabat_556]